MLEKRLEKALSDYCEKARKALRPDAGRESGTVLRLVSTRHHAVRDAVDLLEQDAAFKKLVAETAELEISKQPDSAGITKSDFYEAEVRREIATYLRRSRFYLALASGEAQPFDRFRDAYLSIFSNPDRHLKPPKILFALEAWFHTDRIAFSDFEIRRFTRRELERLLQPEINRIFYPAAITDVEPLKDWWFVVIEGAAKKRTRKLLITYRRSNYENALKIKPPRHPSLSTALLPLACYPWVSFLVEGRPEEERNWSSRPSFPVVIEAPLDLRQPPARAPDLDDLPLEPVFDPVSADFLGGRPMQPYEFGKEETEQFQAFVTDAVENLSRVRENAHWRFIARAGDYMERAYFSRDLDQMLLHLAVVDMLVGGDGGSSNERSAQRVAHILGSNPDKQKMIRERVEKLCGLRDDYVHGREHHGPVKEKHPLEARNLARALFVWFLNFAAEIDRLCASDPQRRPGRDTMMRIIDLGLEEAGELRAIVELRERMPVGFPRVDGWSGQ